MPTTRRATPESTAAGVIAMGAPAVHAQSTPLCVGPIPPMSGIGGYGIVDAVVLDEPQVVEPPAPGRKSQA